MTTLIGTNPDQIPVNSMLGGMAYQDPDSINVKDFKYSGTLSGLGNSSIVSTSGDILSTVHANNATGGAIAILKAGDGTSSSYYSYLRIINNDSSPKTWDIGTRGNDNLHVYDGTNTRVMVSSGTDHVQFNSGNTSFFIGNGATAGGGTTDDTSFNWSLAGAVKLCRNSTLVAEIDSSNNLIMKTTGALKVSEGTTAQRPVSPQEGMIRKNSTLGVIEGYSGGGYVSLEAGRLINIFESMTSGVDSTFNLSPKTSYIIVEMIAGGGGGGGYAGSLSNNTVGLGRSGTPGCAVRFIIKPSDLVSTYYYRIGAGGASSATGTGTDGGDTIFSKEPTSGAMTNYLQCGGGIGGTVGAIYTPPVHLQYSSWPGLTIQGTASSWVKLETTEGYTGENILAVSSDYTAFRSRDQLTTFNQITSRMDCFYYPSIGYRGVGGGGRESKQTSGGVLTSILNATAGLGGMIRIYEYS